MALILALVFACLGNSLKQMQRCLHTERSTQDVGSYVPKQQGVGGSPCGERTRFESQRPQSLNVS